MEGIHGVDVSWLHHSKKGTSKPAEISIPDLTTAANGDLEHGAHETESTPTASAEEPTHHQQHHLHLPHPSKAPDRLESPAQANVKGKDGKASPQATNGGKLSPSGRRNSWMSSISSKFSSNTSPQSPSPTIPQTSKAVQSPFKESSSQLGTTVATNEQGKHPDAAAPSTSSSPSPKSGHPSFLQSAFRRLSSGGGAALGKATGTASVCQRRVMNVDPYRERCDIPDLQPAKLRRVSFSVDVEIAPPARYSEEEPDEPPPQPPPGRRPSLTQLEHQAENKKKKDRKLKQSEGAALKSPKAVAEEKDTEGVVKASGEKVESEKLVAAGSVETEGSKDTSRKREKKKRSEGERKERKERKRKEALAKGEVPRELKKESSGDGEESSTGVNTPPKSQDRPTTDPLRIYRRCCQLRETPILKRITEQISSPSACPTATPGVVSTLDLSGYWMQLSDIVTLGDYLAVVPVKRLILENCGLDDEAVRVLLAGLLAAKTPEQAKHNRKLSKKAIQQIKEGKTEDLGVVEKLSLKNNSKIGKEGWRHICLFLYMSKTLKAIDLSGISLPRASASSPENAKAPTDISVLLPKVIAERPAGSHLEELVIGECGITDDNIAKLSTL